MAGLLAPVPPAAPSTSASPADGTQLLLPPEWSIEHGPPAPEFTTVQHLCSEIARGLADPDIGPKLQKALTNCGAMVVRDCRRDVLKEDLADELGNEGLRAASFVNVLRKYCFGPSPEAGDFTSTEVTTLIRNDSHSDSGRSGQPKFSQEVVIWDLFGSTDRYSLFEFSAPWMVRIVEAMGPMGLSVGNADLAMGRAVTELFMGHVVCFKTCYVDHDLKQRYAYLLFRINRTMALDALVKKIKHDFSNRRQGRLKATYHFNEKEVVNNKAVEQLMAVHPDKVRVDEEGPMYFADVTDYSSKVLVDSMCTGQPVTFDRLEILRPSSATSLSSSSPTLSASSSTRESPVPLMGPSKGVMAPPIEAKKSTGKRPAPPDAFKGAAIKNLTPENAFIKAGFTKSPALPLRPIVNGSNCEDAGMELERWACYTLATRARYARNARTTPLQRSGMQHSCSVPAPLCYTCVTGAHVRVALSGLTQRRPTRVRAW